MSGIKKILIAEDELLVAKVLKLMLEQKGFEVKHVVDEEAAVELATTFAPHLIIMDVFLKNKTSGLNAGMRIRSAKIKAPIIYTTGNSLQQTNEAIKAIENSYLFIKPIDVEHLIRFIETTF